jgi:hypothetical protein
MCRQPSIWNLFTNPISRPVHFFLSFQLSLLPPVWIKSSTNLKTTSNTSYILCSTIKIKISSSSLTNFSNLSKNKSKPAVFWSIAPPAFPEYFFADFQSSTLVISYLMKKFNWPFKQAIKYVRKSRPNVLPNLGF